MTRALQRRAMRRRIALSGFAGGALSLAFGSSSQARGPSVRPEGASLHAGVDPRRLNLIAVYTGEKFSDVFAEGGRYSDQSLAQLNRLLRDYRTGEVKSIDPALFDVLARVQAHVAQPLRVLSGYRSWQTNHLLYMAGFDVAEHSLHIAAKAVDFMVPGVPPAKLGEIARQCGCGGLGIYHQSGFIHVDTGMARNWVGV